MTWQAQYQSQEHAKFYANKRDATLLQRLANRFEQRMIERALRRVQRRARFDSFLDCASGTGRMLPVIANFGGAVVALDTSKEMLHEGRRHHHLFREPVQMVVGSALELPLADQSVDVVMCSRLLHHFGDTESRVRILREFARVARVGVVFSFFDSFSYRGWRRSRRSRTSHKDRGRYAIPRHQLIEEAEWAGLEPLGMNAQLRFQAEVTAAAFLVAPRDARNLQQPKWLTELGLSSMQGLMNFRPTHVAALSGSSETFRIDCAADGTGPRQVFVKRYRYPTLASKLRGLFRGTLFGKSRARMEFDLLTEMRRRGVPAVAPISFVEDRRGGLLRSAALITEGVIGAESLDAYYEKARGRWTRDQSARFFDALADVVSQLHQSGVMHGGLFWRNILVVEKPEGGWTFTFLDPNRRCRLFDGPLPVEARISDLSDFVASGNALQWHSEFEGFLRRYAGDAFDESQGRRFARELMKSAKRKTAQEDHRVAAGSAFAWLQRRIERAAVMPNANTFDTVDGFFDTLAHAQLSADSAKQKAILIEMTGPNGREKRSYVVTLAPDGVVVTQGPCPAADLTVQTDPQTWLDIVNARPAALEAIQAGRLVLEGDKQPLVTLGRWLDEAPVPSK